MNYVLPPGVVPPPIKIYLSTTYKTTSYFLKIFFIKPLPYPSHNFQQSIVLAGIQLPNLDLMPKQQLRHIFGRLIARP